MFFLGADGEYDLQYRNLVYNPNTNQMEEKTGTYTLVIKEGGWSVDADGQQFSGHVLKVARGDWYFITTDSQALFRLNAFGIGEVSFGFTTLRAINRAGIQVNPGGAFSPSRPF